MNPAGAFHFDADAHVYTLGGEIIPSVTQMLARAGYVSEAFYTDDSAFRGQEVHRLCTDLDLGAIEAPADLDSSYKGWVLAYVAFLARVRPEWEQIEVARVHPTERWGGRPDRVGRIWGVEAIVEIKSGGPEKWHGLQTALHDLLMPDLPPGVRTRYGLYLKKTGKFQLIPHDGTVPSCSQGRHDYDKAREILTTCTMA